MKLTTNLEHDETTGGMIVERTLKDRHKNVLKQASKSHRLGPFTLDPVHATVGATVSTTLARNYHSAHISVSVHIPVPATEEGVETGLEYCFEKAGEVMDKHLVGANEALTELADKRR